MTWIGNSACGGDWCGRPPLDWVEPAPPALWLDAGAAVDMLLLVAWCNSTSSVSVKVACFRPPMILGKFWVVGFGWTVGVRLHLPVMRDAGLVC
jgi:hypothetical protein